MSTGYQEEEEYEDELYREDEGSWSSGAESEAEVWLYSQLHYSTGLGQREEEDDGEEGQRRGETGDEEGACPATGRDPNTQRSPGQQWSSDRDSDPDPDSDGVESWMILDGEEQEGDCNILLNVEVRGSSSSSSSSNSSAEDENNAHDWTVSEKDMEAQIGSRCPSLQRTYRYYNATKTVMCQNCRKTGHFSRDCPVPKKRPSCLLCGDEGHLQHACPHRYCPNCCLPGHGFEDCLELAYWHKRCHRCGVTGHFHDACPDIWRQYHLTTQTGTLVKPDRMDAHRNSAYCYNCARRGHFGFACGQRRMSSGIYPNVPYVSRYDSTQDVCQRDSRVQKKAKELQDAGLLVLPPDPQGGDREESPTGKRKKNKGGGGKEAKGATPGARKGERQPGRGKTWPEKRKERRQIKKLRREAMAQRTGATGPALLEEEEEERLFLRGPERIPSGTATPPVKGKASPGLFGSGKRGDWKNRKCRDRKCRDRKCRERKSAKGRKQGALRHEDVYPSDENFLSVKRKARHRKR